MSVECEPLKLPTCLPIGRKVYLRQAFEEQLPDGATLSGTPTIAEIGTPTTQITLAQVNTSEITYEDGSVHAVGTVVTARVQITASKTEPTILKITCGTTDPFANVVEYVQFRTKP